VARKAIQLNQCNPIRRRECKHHLWAWAPSHSTTEIIHRWGCSILLWARVKQPRLSI
jgi:hypothetical protein